MKPPTRRRGEAREKRANVNIEIISGDEEADLIFSNFNAADFDQDKDYLYIDVGEAARN